MRQTREARANATSLCTSGHGLHHDYRRIILGMQLFYMYDLIFIVSLGF